MPPEVLRQAPTPEHISTAPANPPCQRNPASWDQARGDDIRADAEVLARVRVAHDLAGIEPVFRIEGVLDRLECGIDLGPEQLAVPEAAGQAVAVFAAHRPAELDHQVGDLPGDQPQRLEALPGLDVDDRPDVQATDIGVSIAGGRDPVARRSWRNRS